MRQEKHFIQDILAMERFFVYDVENVVKVRTGRQVMTHCREVMIKIEIGVNIRKMSM